MARSARATASLLLEKGDPAGFDVAFELQGQKVGSRCSGATAAVEAVPIDGGVAGSEVPQPPRYRTMAMEGEFVP